MRIPALLILTCSAVSGQVRYGCEPPAAVTAARQRVDLMRGVTPTDLFPAQARQVYQALLRDHSDDVFANLQYLALFRGKGYDEVIGHYRVAMQSHPDDPRYALFYAASLVGTDTPQALARLEQLANPGFPYPYLVTAEIRSYPKFADHNATGEKVLRFLDSCPSYLPAYRWLANSGSGEALKAAAANLRTLVEGRNDRDALAAWRTLWTMEFRVAAPESHPAVRARIAADLATFKDLDPSKDLEALLTLRDGNKLSGNTQAVKALPEPSTAPRDEVYAAMREWSKSHPYPKPGTPPEEAEAHQRLRAEAAAQWMINWPDEPMPPYERFMALSQIAATPEADLVAAADAVIAANRRRPGRFLSTPAVISVAGAYVKRGIRLEQIQEMISAGLREIDNTPHLPESDLFDDRNQRMDQELRHQARIQARTVQFDWATRVSKPLVSHEALRQMRGDLDQLAAVMTQPGMQRFLEKKYWEMMATLADSESRKDDAIRYRATAAKNNGIRAANDAPGWVALNKPLAPLSVISLDGKVWTAADLKGKVAVLNLWATWCQPCVAELPSIQKLHELMKGRTDVVILSVNVDANPGVVEPFLRDKGFSFPVLLAHDYIEKNVPELSIPRNWLVDPSGVLRQEHVGFGTPAEWFDSMRSKIDALAGSRGRP